MKVFIGSTTINHCETLHKYLLIILLTFITHCIHAQDADFCDRTKCHLPKNDKAHFDPYYNGHLCENFNPGQTDFSKEYLKLRQNSISHISKNVTQKIRNYTFDLKSLFNTKDRHQNGVIGLDYRRIKIYIKETIKIDNKLEFLVRGKSNVSNNICTFQGKITILGIHQLIKNYDFPGQAILFAEYEFFEDSTQYHAGFFKGTFESLVRIDHKKKNISLDEDSQESDDGYHNRTYVGTWTSYKNGTSKKCIWGDYRLPFTFDFDCGDGEMRVCGKYEKNGWESFNDGNESQKVDKWWSKIR